MAPLYWVGSCPLCRQGRIVLQRNNRSGTIYAHCEECEQGYAEPADRDAGRGFLTLALDYETSDPDWTAIEGSPWAEHVLGRLG